jgi:YD repeat-containing protein
MQTIRHRSWLGIFLFAAMCLAMPAAAGDKPETPLAPAWTVANPCPACQEWVDLLARERANLEKIGKEISDLEARLPPLNAQQQKLRGEIRSLETQLASQQGTGGSSVDPETGIRIEAVTDAKGTVHITTRDANGNIIEQHTRERRDVSKIKDEITAKQAESDRLNDQEAQIRKDFDYQFAERAKVERAIKLAQEGLEDCIKTKCYAQTSAGPDDRSVVPTPAPMSTVLADSARTETAATPCPECAAEAARAKAALDNLRILLNIPIELRDAVSYDAQVKVATKAADEAYSTYRQCAYQRCRVMVDPEKPSPEEQGTPPSLQLQTDSQTPGKSILDSIDDREAALAVSIGGGQVKEKVPENPLAGRTMIDKSGGGMERIDPPATTPQPGATLPPVLTTLDKLDVKDKSGGGMERIDPPVLVCPKPAANQPMLIGPNSSVGSGAQARDKMKERVGGLIGGLLGGHSSSGSGSHGSDSNQPRTARDPISDKDKQTFTTPDGTRIRIGGKMTPRGPLISIEIVDSPGDGTFQTAYLEDAEGRRAGPLQYWIYEMYRDWTLTVSWTRDTYVNDEHVSHEEGGWSEQGRDLLGRFKVPQANEGIWKRMGFNNATKGIKGLGVVFPNPLQAIAMGPLATALVIHLSRPREDPVVTTPFIFSMVAMPESKLLFQQMQRTRVQERCRDQ